MPRRLIRVEGVVQGVGFRPFVYRIAHQHHLAGLVFNDSHGVQIEIEGALDQLDAFLADLQHELPPLASISALQVEEVPERGESGFRIIDSAVQQERSAQISPDTHVCSDCRTELFDPGDRRFRYPFINCTNCGPRYSIVTDIPYDRPATTMADFPMCPACQWEYDDPSSRRFHAQPNACPQCGPQVALRDPGGTPLEGGDQVAAAVRLLKEGKILAVKGIGGYHLVVDAGDDAAVRRLRQRKLRDEKPFALMSFDLERVRRFAVFGDLEERLLTSVERPIVLLPARAGHGLSPHVAPENKFLGVMLPYTPLHYLLLEPFVALVMTSGNRSDEPISFENADAGDRLKDIADAFLDHNRRIHIRTDDSIVRQLAGRPVLYRRSRGYVPRPVKLGGVQPAVLAMGAELKNTIALTRGEYGFLSHHIGDLKNQGVVDSLGQAVRHLEALLEIEPQVIAHDLHPDYLSTRFAEEWAPALPRFAIQHHHAHLASCLADNGHEGRAIGLIFDGTGYGSDGTIWGGEFLVGDAAACRRAGHLKQLPLPGGDAATREPWRMALSYLIDAFGPDRADFADLGLLGEIPPAEWRLLVQMIEKGINSPLTSSVGRLFDAVACLVGLRNRVSYEGQAALELEMCLDPDGSGAEDYALGVIQEGERRVLDPAPMIRRLVEEARSGASRARLSAGFHNGLAAATVRICGEIRATEGALPVALSGGVFQNRYLTERVVALLESAGFEVLLHRQVPPNDGGLALGQAVIAGKIAAARGAAIPEAPAGTGPEGALIRPTAVWPGAGRSG